MGDRRMLGAADVSDDVLASMVADSLGVDGDGGVDLLTCDAEVAEYDLDALTTAGRYWVRGTARHAGGIGGYAFFVKVVQSWTRSPQFAFIPEHLREVAAAGLPWRNEPLVYRSDLGQRLPAGLSIPRAYVSSTSTRRPPDCGCSPSTSTRRAGRSTPTPGPRTCSAGWRPARTCGR